MEKEQLKTILEAVLMAASSPLSEDALMTIFEENQRPEREELVAALQELISDCESRSYELKQVSSGYRFQVKKTYAEFVSRLWEDKPTRYSRALLETLALIAYRQPITRGEIEAVRGVSVSSQIIKTLDERNWIKVVGHRDVPGKPALYATTKEFLDYFNLQSLDDLPSLQEIRDIDAINAELDLRMPDEDVPPSEQEAAAELETSEQAEQTPAEQEEPSADEDMVISMAQADEDETEEETAQALSASASEDGEDGSEARQLNTASASAEH